MSQDDPGAQPGRARIDVEHVAELANLPLSDEEVPTMADACQEVLEAFGLPEIEGRPPASRPVTTFEDDPEICQATTVEAIVEAFPRRDGRHLIP